MSLSERPKTMIPKGVITFLPDGTLKRRAIEREVMQFFLKNGYQEITTPIFEYSDVLSQGLGENILKKSYQFVDRATGRMMVLRPDVTTQVARIATTLLKNHTLPLRLCYSANIFRHEEEHTGKEREIFQMGVELIGGTDTQNGNIKADIEIISLFIRILKFLGITKFKVVIGQPLFSHKVIQSSGIPVEINNAILLALSKRDTSTLSKILMEIKISRADKNKILSLPSLIGQKEILNTATNLIPKNRLFIQKLKQIYKSLSLLGYQDHLLIDLGEVQGMDYYTGIVFEVFSEEMGMKLGGGGRYDHLIEKFGRPTPATGFALHIEQIQQVQSKSL